jgi:RNA polymerase sigma-70 factor (ECF subfamily)
MTAITLAALPLEAPERSDSPQARFESVVAGHAALLFRYAYWLCRNRTLAEDLVQETFLRAWRSVDSLRDEKATKAWLLTILRREHARHYERYQPAFDEVVTDTLPGWNSHDTSTQAFVLRRALAELPVEYREPLLLQVLAGYSTAEIGEMLGLTRGAVMTRVFRAKRKLRDMLEETGEASA